MLSQSKCRDYYRELSDELRVLARIGKDNQIFTGWHELEDAASALALNKSPKWSYSIRRLEFNVSPNAISWPKPAKSATCAVSLAISGLLEQDSRGETVSGITGLECQLEFTASDQQDQEWYQYWHLDRHPGGIRPPEAHPLFHINFGGKNMAACRARNQHPIFHRVIELEAPRIQLPPMDAILLVDFVISNFDGNKWSSVSADPSYLWILEQSQGRIWAEYVNELADFFRTVKAKREAHKARALWPHLAICPDS